ncbi:alpha/beta hydrolase [Sphingobium sp.]|uniref:alpha/beta hydrolase n=1 Tax=Sphingobium sp. TaxID=1912891 RepID=UPI0028BDDF5F|nr:alpha/beta hydrolase fold domain-containing protein [Sphingobium sp.]
MGARLGRDVYEETLRLFAPARSLDPVAVKAHRDLRYGPHERHRLSIFPPSDPSSSPVPVFLFVHGGGFVQGDTTIPDTPFFDNIGQFAAASNMVGITMTYRLAPADPWPAASVDVEAAIAWIEREIGRFGGDGSKIVLVGSSAGAMAALGVLGAAGGMPASIKAAILRSAIYDLPSLSDGPLKDALKLYYGADEHLWPARLDRRVLAQADIPLLLTLGQFDPPEIREQARLGLEALIEGRKPHRFALLTDHNHYSVDLATGSFDESVDAAMLQFLGGCAILPSRAQP